MVKIEAEICDDREIHGKIAAKCIRRRQLRATPHMHTCYQTKFRSEFCNSGIARKKTSVMPLPDCGNEPDDSCIRLDNTSV